MKRALVACALVAWVLAGPGAKAQINAHPDLAQTLTGLAGRVQQYYDRVGSIICLETVTQQALRSNRTPTGRPRVTTYELMVTRDPLATGEDEFRVERTLQSVNGKRAGRSEEPECTDPKSGTPEPLGFLLAGNQPRYKFSFAGPKGAGSSGGPAGTVAVDFVQTPPDRVKVKWKRNCFSAEGGGQQGRLWFDPATFDVLQMEAWLPRPFLVPRQMELAGSVAIRVESSALLVRFARVKFDHPDETVLLPESTDLVTMFRGVASLRSTQVLSKFRRFLSESVVRPASR